MDRMSGEFATRLIHMEFAAMHHHAASHIFFRSVDNSVDNYVSNRYRQFSYLID
jgi:hypothetical protein